MQVLFLWDSQGQSDVEMARQVIGESGQDPASNSQALQVATGAWDQHEASDRWVGRVAPQWPVHRQPPVNRAILRMAVWEMLNTATPAQVVMDEAIELAKHFSTEGSASFVNGVLDAILKEHKALTSAGDGGAAPDNLKSEI